MEKAVRLNQLALLDNTTVRVFKYLCDRLGDGAAFLNYTYIADDLGVSRHTVKYHVEALVKAGMVNNTGGKLSVRHVIVTLYGAK